MYKTKLNWNSVQTKSLDSRRTVGRNRGLTQKILLKKLKVVFETT